MKLTHIFLVSLFCLHLIASAKNNVIADKNEISTKMKIKIGSSTFKATLYNNSSANAFKAMLPLTINMEELNKNEKFFYFDKTLPTNTSQGGNIQSGDLMLYGNNCLVLFYKNFNTSYSYSKIGRIDNPAELQKVLGLDGITVKFELP